MIEIPRLARKYLESPFLHVMVQGVNKEYIFNKPEYIEEYFTIINKIKEKYNFTIMAYCIMNNHAHFLVYAEDINEFGRFMHKTNLLYAQMYNKSENRYGVLFRNRYKTEPIYDIKYLINCIKYIHNNPVKAGMVTSCEEYKYSSYKDYATNTGVTKSEIIKEVFGKNCDFVKLFNETCSRRFIDIEDEGKNCKEYILDGILEFKKVSNKELYEMLSDRDIFKKLIFFLKEEWGIMFIEIKEFFDIPRGTMESLKK